MSLGRNSRLYSYLTKHYKEWIGVEEEGESLSQQPIRKLLSLQQMWYLYREDTDEDARSYLRAKLT